MTFIVVALGLAFCFYRWYTGPTVTVTDWCDRCGTMMTCTDVSTGTMATAPDGHALGICVRCYKRYGEP